MPSSPTKGGSPVATHSYYRIAGFISREKIFVNAEKLFANTVLLVRCG